MLKDLCARLPYGVKLQLYNGELYNDVLNSIDTGEYIMVNGKDDIENIKPYLFPLSSMSEEQKVIYGGLCYAVIHSLAWNMQSALNELVDWLNKNYFDFRGLIPKDLAKNATGLNIY